MKLINSAEFIHEGYQVANVLDIDNELNDLHLAIDRMVDGSIMALLGDYGSGKSTALYQLKVRNPNETWVWFDAWKYPDRQNMWEGFVLDFARQVDEDSFKEVLSALDGTKNDSLETLIKTIGEGANYLLPGTGIVGKLAYFAKSSPAKRVFQIQDLLLGIASKSERPIRIVVEDIDRSQDQGVYFLETLSHFLKTNDLKCSVKVVAPMAPARFNDEVAKASYQKCVDYSRSFAPALKTHTYVKALISDEAFTQLEQIDGFRMTQEGVIKQVSTFLDIYCQNQGMNFRELKGLMRQWVLLFDNLHDRFNEVDWRVLLCGVAYNSAKTSTRNAYISSDIAKASPYGTFLTAIKNNQGEYIDPTSGSQFTELLFSIKIDGNERDSLKNTFLEARDKDYTPYIAIPKEYFKF